MADGHSLTCECEALREEISKLLLIKQHDDDLVQRLLATNQNIRQQTARECIDIVLARAMCCGCSDVIAERIRERFGL